MKKLSAFESVQSTKKAVNVSVSADVLEAARSRNINLSATLDSALVAELRRRRREVWLAANRGGIEAYNQDVAERGAFGDTFLISGV